MPETPRRRFLTLDETAEQLAVSKNQVYALVRTGDLEGVKIGGRGQWRVEQVKLEEYIARLYEETRTFIVNNPYDQAAEQDSEAEPAVVAAPDHEEVAALVAMSNPLPPSTAVGGNGTPTGTNSSLDAQRDGTEPLEL